MTYEYHDINAKDAIYNLARKYPGGVEALAARMGVSAKVLYNKLQPRVTTHVLTFEEFSLIIEFCREAKVDGYLLPLFALNYQHDVVGFQLPDVVTKGDEGLQASVLKVMSEYGDVTRVIADAKQGSTPEQRRITRKEAPAIKKEFREAFEALAALQALALAEVDEDMPSLRVA